MVRDISMRMTSRTRKVEQEHLPPSLKGRKYYRPTDRGFEAELKKRSRPIHRKPTGPKEE